MEVESLIGQSTREARHHRWTLLVRRVLCRFLGHDEVLSYRRVDESGTVEEAYACAVCFRVVSTRHIEGA